MTFLTGFEKTALSGVETYKMKSTPKKHGGHSGRKIYKLKKEGKKWTCTCPDFKYRRQENGTHCKHIRSQITGKPAWELIAKESPKAS